MNVRRDCPYHGGARISVPRISVHSLSDHRVPANDATAIARASRHTKHVSHPRYRCPLGNSASDTMWEASTIVIAIAKSAKTSARVPAFFCCLSVSEVRLGKNYRTGRLPEGSVIATKSDKGLRQRPPPGGSHALAANVLGVSLIRYPIGRYPVAQLSTPFASRTYDCNIAWAISRRSPR